jgi:hypothetical protein
VYATPRAMRRRKVKLTPAERRGIAQYARTLGCTCRPDITGRVGAGVLHLAVAHDHDCPLNPNPTPKEQLL